MWVIVGPVGCGVCDVMTGPSGVVDDGFGIDPTDQAQLFKRFARIETDANRHLVGMGIGLYLVQEVARAHGGRVLVDSRPAAGSEFTLELPRHGKKR